MKVYSSIIDNLLDDITPSMDEVGLADADKAGKKLLKDTHDEVDHGFVDGLSEGDHNDSHGGSQTASVHSTKDDWRGRSAAALGDDTVLGDALMTLDKAKGEGELEKKEVSDSEIKSYVKGLLNGGMPPVKVAAKLKHLAELQVFNHGMATDYLNQNAGILGLAYIEPNAHMNNCPDTYQRENVKAGGIRAKSVKQIKACVGCQYFKKDASGNKNCGLYHLPVVGSTKELLPIINKITAGIPKESKKAALVKIANRETERISPTVTVMASQNQVIAHERTIESLRGKQGAELEFTSKNVENLHVAGNTMEAIYKAGKNKVGSAKAGHAIRKFVDGLKNTKHKIALSQIDCTFLKQKLAVHNAIVGAQKCGSCTFRQGMHCGLTGGTLLSFPGMDKVASNHKIAADAPKDGRAMLKEYDLIHSKKADDIEIREPERGEVEMGGTFHLDVD